MINLVGLPVKGNTVALTNEISDMAKVLVLLEDLARGKETKFHTIRRQKKKTHLQNKADFLGRCGII